MWNQETSDIFFTLNHQDCIKHRKIVFSVHSPCCYLINLDISSFLYIRAPRTFFAKFCQSFLVSFWSFIGGWWYFCPNEGVSDVYLAFESRVWGCREAICKVLVVGHHGPPVLGLNNPNIWILG